MDASFFDKEVAMKDRDYLSQHLKDLALEVIVYFDQTPNAVRSSLAQFPKFFKTKEHLVQAPETVWWKRSHAHNYSPEPKIIYNDKWLGSRFKKGRFFTGIESPNYLTGPPDKDGNDRFVLPLNDKVHFLPQALSYNHYLSPKTTLKLINFYQDNTEIFDAAQLQYFGFIAITGSDDYLLSEVLKRLDMPNGLFPSKEKYTQAFMSNKQNLHIRTPTSLELTHQ